MFPVIRSPLYLLFFKCYYVPEILFALPTILSSLKWNHQKRRNCSKTKTAHSFCKQTVFKVNVTFLFIKIHFCIGRYSNHLKTEQVWYSNGVWLSNNLLLNGVIGGIKTGPKMSVSWSKVSGTWMVCLKMWSDCLVARPVQRTWLEELMNGLLIPYA